MIKPFHQSYFWEKRVALDKAVISKEAAVLRFGSERCLGGGTGT